MLDTIPTVHQIKQAAQLAGSNNALLQSIAASLKTQTSPSNSITINHQWVPKRLTNGIQTGKDLFNNLYSFKMPDHSLFVTGILHHIAPKACIECVRVLNDPGVGDVHILCDALAHIQKRMQQQQLQHVVVNLSLVISPPHDKLPSIWFGNACCSHPQDPAATMQHIHLLRLGHHLIIQSLTAQGAIIIAASGNESEAATHTAQTEPQRHGPRYPAAYPEVISVGAVNKHGQATSYSDFPAQPPQHNGIATYSGAIPVPVPPHPLQPSQPQPPGFKSSHTWAIVDDALVGLYCSSDYPKLSAHDSQPLAYGNPPESHGCAYWSGTSFSTPIISALVARILQQRHIENAPPWTTISVQDIITTTSGQTLLTANSHPLPNNAAFGLGVGILHAKQTSS